MNWRRILALAVFLAALVAAIVLVERRERGRQAAEGTLLDIAADGVDRIELRNAHGLFVFSRRDGQWQMEKPLAAAADKVALESILDNFSRLKYDRLVQAEGGDLRAFGLDRPEIELRLFLNGAPAAAILLGMKNSLDDSSYATLAPGGKVVTLAAYKRNDLEKELFAFRDKKFLPVDAMAVTSLEYRLGESALALAKKEGRWFLEKPLHSLAAEDKVNDILASASALEALSFVPAAGAQSRRATGLDKPLLEAEFRSGAVSRRIQVGKSGEEYFAWVEGSAEICGIGSDFLQKFVADTGALREKRVALFYAFDVRALSFSQGAFRFGASKDASGAWEFTPPVPGSKPDTAKIEALLSSLAGLEAKEFVDAPQAPSVAATRIVLKTEDPTDPAKKGEIVMEFAAAAGESVIARNPALPYGFRLDREILAKFPSRIEDISGPGAAAAAGK